MRPLSLVCVICLGLTVWAQDSSRPDKSTNPQASDSSQQKSQTRAPNLTPPRSDSVNVNSLGEDRGESSSKDTQIDLTPPADDAKTHPQSSEALSDAEGSDVANGDVREFHPWDPHKAAKDVEVGDYYFKRKNYKAAEDRYREALFYKDNDAIATYRLAICLEKLGRPDDARKEYESYLQILPHGPEAEASQKAIERLKSTAASANPSRPN
jgi:tetratricopeptide (TPR) repeat protein